jgi:hypothetical protein
MNQFVPHARHIVPGNRRVSRPDWFRDMLCSLANDLDALDRGEICFLIVTEFFVRDAFSEPTNPADIIDDVL